MKKALFFTLIFTLLVFSISCGNVNTTDDGNTDDDGNTGDTGNTDDNDDADDSSPDDETCIEGERRCSFTEEAVEICKDGEWEILRYCDGYCSNGDCEVADDLKPNIYLYPNKTQQISVVIDFPKGGFVTVSEPLYNNGWNVTVTPEGVIDDEFTYLFYESVQPDFWQKKSGWVVETETLEDFFVTTLESYGFEDNEITDFIEWWIPRLTDFPYYIIYPQTAVDIEKVNILNILPAPESILRFRFHISGSNSPFHKIDIPVTPKPFERNGYTVTEWGVILGTPVN